jgi:hypothetical protein
MVALHLRFNPLQSALLAFIVSLPDASAIGALLNLLVKNCHFSFYIVLIDSRTTPLIHYLTHRFIPKRNILEHERLNNLVLYPIQ